MIRCTRCILPETVPGIQFDDDGVCNFCLQYEKSFSDWNLVKEKKKAEFTRLLETARKLKRPYDCLIPLSGGKDSTYVLYLCARVYGLKCLAVTFENGYMSERAKQNINRALNSTKVDHLVYRMNHEDTIRLFKTFFTQTGEFCNACMRCINFSIETGVKRFKIPLIIKGSGKRVQYVSQITGISNSNSPFFFKRVLRVTENQHRFHYLGKARLGFEIYKIAYILQLPRTLLMRFFPQSIGIYDYIYHPYPEIIEIIKKEMNWQNPDDTFEHFDCALHSIPFYVDTLKIPGITPHTFHNSGLIRQGLIFRADALKIEKEQLKHNIPPIELESLLKDFKLNITEFEKYIKHTDPERYIPIFEKLSRRLYHKLYYKK